LSVEKAYFELISRAPPRHYDLNSGYVQAQALGWLAAGFPNLKPFFPVDQHLTTSATSATSAEPPLFFTLHSFA
jgi:hypothetical protein